MSYVISARGGRYLGDSENMIVHDLLYEVSEPGGCGVEDTLKQGTAVGFFPDRADQAKIEGFKPCPKCME